MGETWIGSGQYADCNQRATTITDATVFQVDCFRPCRPFVYTVYGSPCIRRQSFALKRSLVESSLSRDHHIFSLHIRKELYSRGGAEQVILLARSDASILLGVSAPLSLWGALERKAKNSLPNFLLKSGHQKLRYNPEGFMGPKKIS